MAFFHAHLQLALLFFLRSAASTCFNPDGSAVTDTDYQPCNLVANSISMCCATNRPVGVRDQCLSNGLCFNPCGDDGNCGGLDKGNYWRESCTDQSWNSPNCLRGVCSNSAVRTSQRRGRWRRLMRTGWRKSQQYHSHVTMFNGR